MPQVHIKLTERLDVTSAVKLLTLNMLIPNLQLSLHLTKSVALFLWGRENHGPSHAAESCAGCMSGWASRREATCFTCILFASAANMTVDWALPGGTCSRGAGHVLTPHTTQPLVDNKHLTTANSSLKSKCTFAQKL